MFRYTVLIRPHERDGSVLVGQCRRPPGEGEWPARVGDCPFFELRGNFVTLRRSESWLSTLMDKRYRQWKRPVAEFTFCVGPAVAAIARPGDLVSVYNLGTAQKAVTIVRDGHLVLALGAVAGLPLGDGVRVSEDRRRRQWCLYDFAEKLHYPRTHVVWFDARENDVEKFCERVYALPRRINLIVAVAGTRREDWMWDGPPGLAALESRVRERENAVSFHHVKDRFRTEQSWRTYMDQVPRGMPDDLFVGVSIRGIHARLRDGETCQIESYHVRVQRVGSVWGGSMLLLAHGSAGAAHAELGESLDALSLSNP